MNDPPLQGTLAARPDVSIIVVSYNTCEMTLACLESVQTQTRDNSFELIVIDNASDDGSADAIAARFPCITLIRSDSNLGFARANNVASLRAQGAYLLLLNPDTVILNGAIDNLLAFARRRPEAMIWGGRTVYADGSLNPASCWRDMDLWNLTCRATGLSGLFPGSPLFNAEAYGGWPRDTERAVDIVTGCFLLTPLELWRRLDGFDLSFVMYGEEADLCRRARALGARPRVTPEAEIIHHGGASERVRADKMTRLLRAKNALIRKHWRSPAREIGLWLNRMWPLSRLVATTFSDRILGRGGDARSSWIEIWRRRSEWRDGWPLKDT